jgi:hypothetical protein
MTALTALPSLHSHADRSPDADGPPRPVLVTVVPWDDPVVDAGGIDPRSAYVERCWLPLLGPSATWFLRFVADRLDAHPDGFPLDLDGTARAIGLGGLGSRHSPFRRAILRCGRYGLVRHVGPDTLAVRRAVTPIPHRHVGRLPPAVQDLHNRWIAPHPAMATERRRARLLALDLVILGEDPAGIERRLLRWGVHPALAYEAAEWGSSRPAFDP